MSTKPRVLVMMTTYNGFPFIEEQLRSIKWQTDENWLLLVSDDGSTDGTVEFLENASAQDERIKVIANTRVHGAYANFRNVIDVCKAEQQTLFGLEAPASYYFFADQDDIWEPDKIETMRAELERLEAEHSTDTPLLCYANKVLIDGNGEALGRTTSSLDDCLLANNPLLAFFGRGYASGMAMAFNKALFGMPIWVDGLENDLAHDSYLPMYAALFGAISYLKQPLARYRRHGKNVSGDPEHKYGIASGIWAFFTKMSEITENRSRVAWASLVCLNHLPYENDLSRELRDCFERGGLRAVRLCHKYNIRPRENFFTIANMYFNLLTCAYKRSKYFTEEPYINGLGKSMGRL